MDALGDVKEAERLKRVPIHSIVLIIYKLHLKTVAISMTPICDYKIPIKVKAGIWVCLPVPAIMAAV